MEEEIVIEEIANKEDFIFDQVKGSHGKKTALSLLNKKLVGKHEMDELFCDWD
ncbi:MAG: hypothetical protein ABII01_02060 [Candidatus Woesearchaeota archaeon]